MLILAIILLILAVIIGFYLLSFVLKNKNTPKAVVFTHGSLAAIGLIILIIYAFFHKPFPGLSIILFILAALGGFTLIYRDLTSKSLPKWLVLSHGGIAIIAFIFLIAFMFFS